MNIIYCSAEVEPFAKSGGLGDVMGALPKAIATKGHKVSVVMPKYNQIIPQRYLEQMKYIGYMFVDVNWRHQYCGVFKLTKDKVTYYFIDNEYYFNQDLYCFADSERFAFFSKACLDLVGFLGKSVDVIHCNDWSTALIPVLFDKHYRNIELYSNTKLVYTIHNLRYQGITSKWNLQDLTGLDEYFFTDDKLMHRESVNLMKGGIVFSDMITTVSPTYAQEINTDEYSEWLGDVIDKYNYKLRGILNGVDYSTYNPIDDMLITANYDQSNVSEGKASNKEALQQRLSLPIRADVPVIGIVTRLVDQKGLDLMGAIMDRLLCDDVQLVVVGTGDSYYENMLRDYANRYPTKLSANIMFDNGLAHQVYAGCDMFLVPSKFEPCGLSQLISLKYGTLPIVRETGGLRDTVMSYNQYTNQGNGFSFTHYNADDLLYTIRRAVDIYNNDKSAWAGIISRAMACDYSWDISSQQYLEMYGSLCGIKIKPLKKTLTTTSTKSNTTKSTKAKTSNTITKATTTAKSTTAKSAKTTASTD